MFNGKIHYKWAISHGYVKSPEGKIKDKRFCHISTANGVISDWNTPASTSQIIGRKTWPRHPRATQRIPWPDLHVLGLRVWGWADWKAGAEIPHVTSHFEVQLLSTASTIKIVCLPVGSQVFFGRSNLSTCKLECFEMSGPRLIISAGHWSHWHCSSEIFRIWT